MVTAVGHEGAQQFCIAPGFGETVGGQADAGTHGEAVVIQFGIRRFQRVLHGLGGAGKTGRVAGRAELAKFGVGEPVPGDKV